MDLQDYRRTHTRLLETKTQDMRQDLLKDISAVVNTMASEAGYTLVLEKSGNTMNLIPPVLFSQGSLEITDAVIKKLNAGKPAPESK
jgi:Skp family chaperone for outer membrane proteins